MATLQQKEIEMAKQILATTNDHYAIKAYFEKKYGIDQVVTHFEKDWSSKTVCGQHSYIETCTIKISARKRISYTIADGMLEPTYRAL